MNNIGNYNHCNELTNQAESTSDIVNNDESDPIDLLDETDSEDDLTLEKQVINNSLNLIPDFNEGFKIIKLNSLK